MKALGIDYGDSYIGFALSDIKKVIAFPFLSHKTLGSMRKDIDFTADLAKKNSVDCIVLGLPLNMDGSEGARASKTRAFGRNLQKVSKIEVIYRDERLTSVVAEEILAEGGVKKEKQRTVVDKLAAQIILQDYLDTLENKLL